MLYYFVHLLIFLFSALTQTLCLTCMAGQLYVSYKAYTRILLLPRFLSLCDSYRSYRFWRFSLCSQLFPSPLSISKPVVIHRLVVENPGSNSCQYWIDNRPDHHFMLRKFKSLIPSPHFFLDYLVFVLDHYVFFFLHNSFTMIFFIILADS